MLKDLIMQILGKKRIPPVKKVATKPKFDDKKFKHFKFKPMHGDDRVLNVVISRDVMPDDYKKEIELLKIPRDSKEMTYLKEVWNKNFPKKPLD